jgi:hypothetical protein
MQIDKPMLERVGELTSTFNQIVEVGRGALDQLKGLSQEIEAEREMKRRRMDTDAALAPYRIELEIKRENGMYRATYVDGPVNASLTDPSDLRTSPKLAIFGLADKLDKAGVLKQ